MADVTPRSSLTKVVNWRAFLTDFPVGTRASVEGAIKAVESNGRPTLATPELRLHCDGSCQTEAYCSGTLRVGGFLFPNLVSQDWWDSILTYQCQTCQTFVKTYAIRAIGDQTTLQYPTADISKLGEWPPFSFLTPSKVAALVGPDRELFFKGRKAESEGLGVGAFAYYRRIVEDQKNRLIDEIIKVARRTNAPTECISLLEHARLETQFKKAVEMIKDAVPPALFLKGHNPLTLLHNALSRNLHGGSDEECLQIAHDVRIILFELAEQIGRLLKDERELNDAISHLLNG